MRVSLWRKLFYFFIYLLRNYSRGREPQFTLIKIEQVVSSVILVGKYPSIYNRPYQFDDENI